MAYEYRMVQFLPHIEINESEEMGNEAATYLFNIVDQQASQGWEFLRIDSINVTKNPNGIKSLFGGKPYDRIYYVATFRKEK